MQKTIASPALLSLIILVSSLTNAAEGDLECRISRSSADSCTPHLVIAEGNLNISVQDTFILEGRYDACYHSEIISIRGRVNRTVSDDRLSMELLATEIRQPPSRLKKGSTTIGTVILGTQDLEGYFFDVWASVRSHGSFHHEPYSRPVYCTEK